MNYASGLVKLLKERCVGFSYFLLPSSTENLWLGTEFGDTAHLLYTKIVDKVYRDRLLAAIANCSQFDAKKRSLMGAEVLYWAGVAEPGVASIMEKYNQCLINARKLESHELDMLWFIYYCSGEYKYAERVKMESVNPNSDLEVRLAAGWSYTSHVDTRRYVPLE